MSVETIQEQLCTSAGRELEEEQAAECDDPVEDQGEDAAEDVKQAEQEETKDFCDGGWRE